MPRKTYSSQVMDELKDDAIKYRIFTTQCRQKMKWYKKDQHFLIDDQVLERIIEYGKLTKTDTVLEIGAGYGTLQQTGKESR